MPGYVIHMATANRFFRLCGIEDDVYKNDFIIGSIAPDVKRGNDKKISHFWSDYAMGSFVRRPELKDFTVKYGERLSEPYVFGFYCHLLLDVRFLDVYWKQHFQFFDENMHPEAVYDKVKFVKLDDKDIYDRNIFFSPQLYYGDYNRMNRYYIEKYEVMHIKPNAPSSVIDEVNPVAEIETIGQMLDNAFLKNEESDEEPKVFCKTDLDELIESTAEIIAEIYYNDIKK
ncbi:MAG: hypothetical protein K2H01_04240 [Ruminococcus sp.]|nr:hypothetical protein [Ruminococcus sp.]